MLNKDLYVKGVEDMILQLDSYLKAKPKSWWHWTTVLCDLKRVAEKMSNTYRETRPKAIAVRLYNTYPGVCADIKFERDGNIAMEKIFWQDPNEREKFEFTDETVFYDTRAGVSFNKFQVGGLNEN